MTIDTTEGFRGRDTLRQDEGWRYEGWRYEGWRYEGWRLWRVGRRTLHPTMMTGKETV